MILEATSTAAPRIEPTATADPMEVVARASAHSRVRARKRRPFLALACISYLLTMVGVCLFLRLQGDRSWLGTFLLMAPRWPFAVPVAVLLPWAVIARRWVMTSVTVAAAIVAVCPLMGFRLSLPANMPQRGDLRLLTFNVHRQHVDIAKLAAVIAEAQPDVIAMQDWSAALQKPLFGDGNWHTRQVGELFVASRFPIDSAVSVNFNDPVDAPKAERGAAAAFELTTPHGVIHLVNLHLASPHSALNSLTDDGGADLNRNALRRWAESEKVRATVDGVGGPVVVTGDFNTTDDSPIFREHWQDFADAFLERGFGLGYTYLNDHTQFRIDHVLSDASWKPLHAWVGPEAGSPHRPLIVDLQRE